MKGKKKIKKDGRWKKFFKNREIAVIAFLVHRMDSMNEAQRHACTSQAAVVVIHAGPGSGKTR